MKLILFLIFSLNGVAQASFRDLALSSVEDKSRFKDFEISLQNLNQKYETAYLKSDDDRVIDIQDVSLLYELHQSLIEKMFKTVRGKDFCELLNDGADLKGNLKGFFQMRASLLSAVYKECLRDPHYRKEGHGQRLPTSYLNKTYQVVFKGKKGKRNFSSWTSQLGPTYLFIYPDTTVEEFVRSIIHEWYISFDVLLGLRQEDLEYYFDDLTRYEKSLEFRLSEKEINTLPNLLQKRIRALDARIDYHFVYSLPLMKYSLMSLRAYQYEQMTLENIGWFESRDYKELSCDEHLKKLVIDLAPVQRSFISRSYVSSIEVQQLLLAGYSLEELDALTTPGPLAWEILLDKFLSVKKRFRHISPLAPKKVSLCQLFSVPMLGLASNLINRGPKPRTTGGWRVADLDKLDIKDSLDDETKLLFEKYLQELQDKDENNEAFLLQNQKDLKSFLDEEQIKRYLNEGIKELESGTN